MPRYLMLLFAAPTKVCLPFIEFKAKGNQWEQQRKALRGFYAFLVVLVECFINERKKTVSDFQQSFFLACFSLCDLYVTSLSNGKLALCEIQIMSFELWEQPLMLVLRQVVYITPLGVCGPSLDTVNAGFFVMCLSDGNSSLCDLQITGLSCGSKH